MYSINVRVIVTIFIKILGSKTLSGEISFRELEIEIQKKRNESLCPWTLMTVA